MSAKRKRTFSDHIKAIMKKHKQNGIHAADNLFSMYSFDGAMMRQGTNKIVNMISFSTLLFLKTLQDFGLSTANSCIILTWQQVDGQETNRIVHASVKKHYEEKKKH